MFEITETIQIPEEELIWSFARSGGPGGQNVNKVASKAILKWGLVASDRVAPYIKRRMKELYPSRVTEDGIVVISSQENRDQARNREACLEKLKQMIITASRIATVRRETKPTLGSKKRRLDEKKRTTKRIANRKVQDD